MYFKCKFGKLKIQYFNIQLIKFLYNWMNYVIVFLIIFSLLSRRGKSIQILTNNSFHFIDIYKRPWMSFSIPHKRLETNTINRTGCNILLHSLFLHEILKRMCTNGYRMCILKGIHCLLNIYQKAKSIQLAASKFEIARGCIYTFHYFIWLFLLCQP